MMKLYKGYLAHPVLSRKTVRKWELQFERKTGIELINPFIDVEREEEENLHASEAGNYDGVKCQDIVNGDLQAIADCNFVVAFVTGQRSYGTIMEICYAYSMNKPVFIICENGHENHPWLKFHSDKIFTNTAQFKEYITQVNQ